MPFRNAVDIANRALQWCGIARIADFTDDSLQATETAFVYDKLRRAELRRNFWKFAIRKVALRPIDATTMLLRPLLWQSTKTYAPGAIVSDQDNYPWQSRIPDNKGNSPGNSSAWEAYCGPLTAQPFDIIGKTAYFAGEIVYQSNGDGTFTAWVSMQSGNSADPRFSTPWDATVSYAVDNVVVRSAIVYTSLIDFNLGNDPAAAPALWSSTTTYSIGQLVGGSDGAIYSSVVNSNLNFDPVSDSGVNWTNTGVLNPWMAMTPFGTAAISWLQCDVALAGLTITWPIGSGPSNHSFTRNAYRLPANFLRQAPQDPKAGSMSFLGAPAGLQMNDWNVEGDFIISQDTDPIVLRFVADLTDVTSMDDLFCEGLGAHVAKAVVERLTQSTVKMVAIAQGYKDAIAEARLVNAIETGPIEPPLDDYLACRA
jgi:hypothetical protein